ncbi:glycoside hydrolase family 43 protein [Melissococcus plutonius]|uniref:Xylan 1,4-beta-xylosidase n=2 Tax=Melissococcus plutonius TaxID=33970 RepID=A0A2Z5Y422_9ENTE|nr:glycoside hydrolase family 43 protein [Melissococcus plutonius]BAL62634.1 beta-xylosidase [Melissococcus plutonius DAT561]MCV2498559.1 glycoside hydrolase family 43 protein [Melissococcus plutonius]MCV2501746.1 glycoside hydrolase family 43 protein [Melissococcus plutonius]MCV2504773.1 glycoside hydrolase family 43 protein [Melissococcus plutonius]MCV2507233.1 glycoside hydrolase family 43 protein [Melissococcus plutonius]
MKEVVIKNPILRGFNPDPVILRVDNHYYLAVSSFEWLPGIRVYHSDNLVNWEHATDILTNYNQVDLKGNPKNGSIWAPELSFFNGKFYCIYTDVKSTDRPFKDCHNYLITASQIEGPWSTPIYLNSSGFDPSLFHDQDGRKWLLNEQWDYRKTTGNKSAGIVMQEFDEKQAKLIGPIYKIFDGTPLAKTEAPHLYLHDDYYYLLTAEGGTGKGHSVTVCRSKNLFGPYEVDPNYPMLTAKDHPNSPIQCAGHGSIVQGRTGKWYMAYLMTRPINQEAAILGRETAIQEIVWTKDHWLHLASENTLPASETVIETIDATQQEKNTNFNDDFTNSCLAKEWNSRRIFPNSSWCDLKTKPGYLRLISGESLQSHFEQHLLAIRQKDFHFNAYTRFSFDPKTFNQMAGLTLYLNENNYLYLFMTFDEKKGKCLRKLHCQNGEFKLEEERITIETNTISLKVQVDELRGTFYYRESESSAWQPFGSSYNLKFLSGGFTGNFVGICVQDLGNKAGCFADFSYFNYEGKDA